MGFGALLLAGIPFLRHYTRFLIYATERMFHQGVGGRYRVTHNLLRDHFAAIEPKQVKSG